MAASETPANQEAEAFQMPTLDSAGLQIRQDRGEQGVLPSRQQDAGISLLSEGDAPGYS